MGLFYTTHFKLLEPLKYVLFSANFVHNLINKLRKFSLLFKLIGIK